MANLPLYLWNDLSRFQEACKAYRERDALHDLRRELGEIAADLETYGTPREAKPLRRLRELAALAQPTPPAPSEPEAAGLEVPFGLRAMPLAIAGHVQQPGRLYIEVTQDVRDRLTASTQQLTHERERAERAEAFKTWVHNYLDGKGVPADPDPEGNAKHGCRISGRMNWAFAKLAAAEAEIVRLAKLPTWRAGASLSSRREIEPGG